MNKEIKEKWIADLRSGEYKQCKNTMYDGEGYCCLGVLAFHSLPYPYSIETYRHPYNDIGKFIRFRNMDHCVDMNDYQDKNFNEIADWIEENI